MAEIIDFSNATRNRFYNWVSQYVRTKDGGDIQAYLIEVLLAHLVIEKVFTFVDLRAELDKHKISLHQNFFDRAAAAMGRSAEALACPSEDP